MNTIREQLVNALVCHENSSIFLLRTVSKKYKLLDIHDCSHISYSSEECTRLSKHEPIIMRNLKSELSINLKIVYVFFAVHKMIFNV